MTGTESQTQTSVLNVEYGPIEGPKFGLGIHRASLFNCLYKAALKTKIHFILGSVIENSHVELSGRYVTTSKGESHGPYDLVIDASGATSHLSPIKAKALSFGALWGTVDWIDNSALSSYQLTQCYKKANKMMGVLPLGTLPDDNTPKAAVFWSEPRASLPDWPKDSLETWLDEAYDLWPEFEPFISQITHPSQMTPATYSHGTLEKPYADKLVIIGDAAHQASPQLGQGANMALLDAQALYLGLLKYADMDKALRYYTRRRYFHVRLYQIFSSIFTPFYQSDSHILPWLRNHVMNPISQAWPFKPMLTKLVCGNLIKVKY